MSRTGFKNAALTVTVITVDCYCSLLLQLTISIPRGKGGRVGVDVCVCRRGGLGRVGGWGGREFLICYIWSFSMPYSHFPLFCLFNTL